MTSHQPTATNAKNETINCVVPTDIQNGRFIRILRMTRMGRIQLVVDAGDG